MPSTAAPACWNGVPPAKLRYCLARAHRADQLGRPGRPADLPARDRERLAERGDRQRALGHPVERGQRHVLAVEDEVLVDLVADRDQVVLAADRGDRLELVAREDLAGRVVRRVEHQRAHARPGGGGAQRVDVERPVGRAQRDRPADAARERDRRRVGVVGRVDQRRPRRRARAARAAPRRSPPSPRRSPARRRRGRARSRSSAAGARRSPRAAPAPRPAARTGWRRSGSPRCAASSSAAGPSSSGKPWPRLIAPVRSASAENSVKIVVPKPASREAITRANATGSARTRAPRRAAVEPRRGLDVGGRRHARELRRRRGRRAERRRAAGVERVRAHQRALAARRGGGARARARARAPRPRPRAAAACPTARRSAAPRCGGRPAGGRCPR